MSKGAYIRRAVQRKIAIETLLKTMSARRGEKDGAQVKVEELRASLEDLKAQARATDAAEIAGAASFSAEFDKLSPIEQSAASLGVSPTSWKPISFLNNKHYDQLISANMLDDNLARRIEAFRTMAAAEASS